MKTDVKLKYSNKNFIERDYTMDKFEENLTPEDEEMTVTLELDDGSVTCAIVSIFNVGSQDYIALLPLNENGQNDDGEVWIYRYFEDENDSNKEPVLEYIDDDAEYEMAADAFDEYLDSKEFDEIISSDDN